MNHQGSSIIETERLILRPFKADDAEDMFNNWTSDSEVTKYLTSWTAHDNVEVTCTILDMWIKKHDEPSTYRWGITYKENGNHVIGSIDVVSMNENCESAEIGYCLSRSFWSKGIMSEALKAVIDHLFSSGFGRVSARHDTNNRASGKVMLKSGMQYEGTFKRAEKNNKGEFIDMAYYAVTK